MTTPLARPVLPSPPSSNGARPAGQRVGVGRQRRVPWIMLGLLLTAGAALAVVLVVSSTGNRVSVVTAARDLAPGRPLTLADLRTVTIAADAPVRSVAADRAGDLVGRVPVAPLASGTLLHSDLFATGSDLAEGETVVGASLRPGEVPADNLRPGDRVALVQVASNNPTDAGESAVLTVGSVYGVHTTKESGDVVVSLRVPLADGPAVANAAGQKRLRLILVPPGTAPADLEGIEPTQPGTSAAPTTKAR